VGDQVLVQTTVPIGGAWNPSNLEVYAIVQKSSGTKEIYQAGVIQHTLDFDVSFAPTLKSVPQGNGEALFTGRVKNISTVDDVLTLSMDTGFGWPTEFQVGSDPTWHADPLTLPLAAGDSATVTVKVMTDNVKRVGTGSFMGQSSVTGRSGPFSLQVYNKSYSILFVDDDGMRTDDTAFTVPFGALGYLYENWDVYNGHGNSPPSASKMIGFDVVVWQTGYNATAINTTRQSALMAYLDAGGNLYMNDMDLTNNVYPPNVFAVNYLGMATRILNTMSTLAVGVAGDPISAGMSIPLTYMAAPYNRVDTVTPTAAAHTIFVNETGNSNALANEPAGGGRVVFNTIIQNAFDTAGAAPNNNQTVVERTINWLTRQGISSAPEGAAIVSSRLAVVPNPFAANADVHFSLSPQASAGAVRLTVVDVTGRQVRTLVDGRLSAGAQLLRWNGADDLGRALPSGIYFSRLQTAEGTKTQKVILAR
jgi:hypothetical protein